MVKARVESKKNRKYTKLIFLKTGYKVSVSFLRHQKHTPARTITALIEEREID